MLATLCHTGVCSTQCEQNLVLTLPHVGNPQDEGWVLLSSDESLPGTVIYEYHPDHTHDEPHPGRPWSPFSDPDLTEAGYLIFDEAKQSSHQERVLPQPDASNPKALPEFFISGGRPIKERHFEPHSLRNFSLSRRRITDVIERNSLRHRPGITEKKQIDSSRSRYMCAPPVRRMFARKEAKGGVA